MGYETDKAAIMAAREKYMSEIRRPSRYRGAFESGGVALVSLARDFTERREGGEVIPPDVVAALVDAMVEYQTLAREMTGDSAAIEPTPAAAPIVTTTRDATRVLRFRRVRDGVIVEHAAHSSKDAHHLIDLYVMRDHEWQLVDEHTDDGHGAPTNGVTH